MKLKTWSGHQFVLEALGTVSVEAEENGSKD